MLARALLSSTQEDVSAWLPAVKDQLTVPVTGLVSDGQATIRDAIACVFPKAPHQVCQFHSLREAAQPIFEADRHAKKDLKQQVRGIRPIERSLEARTDAEAEARRGYCLAVRSALTDDGSPPLCASGLKLQERLQRIVTSIEQVEQKRGFPLL